MSKKICKQCWLYIVIVGMISLAIVTMLLFVFGKCNTALLGYSGALEGALATIVAVIATINDNKKQQLLATKPILQSNSEMLTMKNQIDEIKEKTFLSYPFNGNESAGKSDYLTRDIYINEKYVDRTRYLAVQYSVSNAGVGPAVDVMMTINGYKAHPNFFLSNYMTKNFIIITTLEKAKRPLKLAFKYTDIYSEFCYTQEDELYVDFDEDNFLTVIQKQYGIGKAEIIKYVKKEKSRETN